MLKYYLYTTKYDLPQLHLEPEIEKIVQFFCDFGWCDIVTMLSDNLQIFQRIVFIPFIFMGQVSSSSGEEIIQKTFAISLWNSSFTFRLEGILPLSKTKRNRCSSSASLSENFQKCWIGYTKITTYLCFTSKVDEKSWFTHGI